MKVKVVQTKKELADAYSIRKKVFVEEQQVPLEREIDQYDAESIHFVLYDGLQKPIGNGRFRQIDGFGKVERVCILSESRKKGLGNMIMNAIEDYAKQQQINKLKLNAQTHAIPFYEKLGYSAASEEFLEEGIPHKTMLKSI